MIELQQYIKNLQNAIDKQQEIFKEDFKHFSNKVIKVYLKSPYFSKGKVYGFRVPQSFIDEFGLPEKFDDIQDTKYKTFIVMAIAKLSMVRGPAENLDLDVKIEYETFNENKIKEYSEMENISIMKILIQLQTLFQIFVVTVNN